MYYRVKVWSKEDCSQKEIYYISDNFMPCVVIECLEQFFKMATKYQVKITALPPNVTKLKKKYKVWDVVELKKHISELKFYHIKMHEKDKYICVATFYKEKPFDIEIDFFKGQWYTFFKRPGKYTSSIWITINEILGGTCDMSKNGNTYVADKFIFINDASGNWNLMRFMGTHINHIKEELES